MMWINHYLNNARYVDGGRGPIEFDCWGLVREVRAKYMGRELLPVYGDLRNDNPRAFTKAYRTESCKLKRGLAAHGAIAAVMVGGICVHVAIVVEIDSELKILEINPDKGARIVRLSDWLHSHLKVTYHND